MKYLSDYLQEDMKTLRDKLGGFYACDDKQFDEQKVEGVEYVGLGMQLIMPKKNTAEWSKSASDIYVGAIKKDIKENGLEKIVIRELNNHECFYTGDITSCLDTLEHYEGVDEALVMKCYRKEFPRWEKCNQ